MKKIYGFIVVLMLSIVVIGCGEGSLKKNDMSNDEILSELFNSLNSGEEKESKSRAVSTKFDLINLEKTKISSALSKLETSTSSEVANLASKVKASAIYSKRYSKDGNEFLFSFIIYSDNSIEGIFYLTDYKGLKNYVFLFNWVNGKPNLVRSGLVSQLPNDSDDLDKPVLKVPQVTEQNVDFSWNQVDGAEKYRFLVSTNNSFSGYDDSIGDCVDDSCYTRLIDRYGTEQKYSRTMSKANQTYYWKVRVENSDADADISDWSRVSEFKTEGVSSSEDSTCQQDKHGGQCVIHVRNYFGGSYTTMPGLCVYADCGAHNAYGYWNLGYGEGKFPKNKSMMVIAKQSGLSVGHIAVVFEAQNNYNGTWTLTVHESNWDLDEKIDCAVTYVFDESKNAVLRENKGGWMALKGFIYSN